MSGFFCKKQRIKDLATCVKNDKIFVLDTRLLPLIIYR